MTFCIGTDQAGPEHAGKQKGGDDKDEDDEAQEVAALLKRIKAAHPPPEILKVGVFGCSNIPPMVVGFAMASQMQDRLICLVCRFLPLLSSNGISDVCELKAHSMHALSGKHQEEMTIIKCK